MLTFFAMNKRLQPVADAEQDCRCETRLSLRDKVVNVEQGYRLGIRLSTWNKVVTAAQGYRCGTRLSLRHKAEDADGDVS